MIGSGLRTGQEVLEYDNTFSMEAQDGERIEARQTPHSDSLGIDNCERPRRCTRRRSFSLGNQDGERKGARQTLLSESTK